MQAVTGSLWTDSQFLFLLLGIVTQVIIAAQAVKTLPGLLTTTIDKKERQLCALN